MKTGAHRPAPRPCTWTRRPRRPSGAWRRAALLLLAACPGAYGADASIYLLTPTVTEGEREIDFHAGVGSAGRSTRHEDDAGLGFGMGVTANWFTELAIQYRRSARDGTTIDAFEWENIVQLAEPGEWPLDVGIAVEVEQPRDPGEGTALRAGPLLQKEFGRFQANANVLVSRHFHTAQFPQMQSRYQAQIKYRDRQQFEYGIQAFGIMGSRAQSWTTYERQTHRVGPVAMGRLSLAGERSLSYNAALLLGTTAHSADRTLRVQLEYEF